MGVAGRRRLVAQPGRLTLGFVLHLVFYSFKVFDKQFATNGGLLWDCTDGADSNEDAILRRQSQPESGRNALNYYQILQVWLLWHSTTELELLFLRAVDTGKKGSPYSFTERRVP